jgi:hypothetical protein
MSKLLIDERPLILLPSLAKAIGLNEALILQQIHFWIQSGSAHLRNKRRWVYNSVRDWQEQFPFFSPTTIWRALRKLEQRHLVVRERFNSRRGDQTGWYTINYRSVSSWGVSKRNRVFQNDEMRDRQNETTLPKKDYTKNTPSKAKPLPKIKKETPSWVDG